MTDRKEEISMKQTIRRLTISICIAVLFLTGMPAAFSAEDTGMSCDKLTGIPLYHDSESGGIRIELPADEFNSRGYAYGDSVNVTFSNGYAIQDLPYYNGYYVRPGETVLRGAAGKKYLKASVNYGEDLWKTADLSENDTADISLCEKGKYLDVQKACDLHYVDDRSDYPGDEVFANFRSMTGGSLKKDYLYRSASPCNNKHNRARYADRLIRDAGVLCVLNLADPEEKIQKYAEKDDFDSPYYLSLYKEGKVVLAPLNMNYTSENFRNRLITGLKAMACSSGPYLIHCTEGKDRTGFVCMLLEALAGCSFDEILEDYMLTYENYYGVSKDNDPEKYGLIARYNIICMLCFLTGEEEESLLKADLSACAERYLKDGGMSDEDISLLKSMISKQPVP